MNVDVKFEGLPELNQALVKLIKSMNPEKVEPILRKGAAKLAVAIRADTPQGPTRNLYKAVRVKKLQRWGNQPSPFLAAIDRKKAPHAHLVISGSKGIRVGKRGAKKYRGKKFGTMPANPFFERAIKAKQAQVVAEVSAGIKKLIEGAVK